jgi:hypothetical protein
MYVVSGTSVTFFGNLIIMYIVFLPILKYLTYNTSLCNSLLSFALVSWRRGHAEHPGLNPARVYDFLGKTFQCCCV